MVRSFLVLIPLVGTLSLTQLAAQSSGQAESGAPCDPCAISLEPEVALGTQSGPGILSGSFDAIATDNRGRFYVNDSQGSHKVFVFSREGEFVSAIGRQGGGPGEFQNIGVLSAAGGQLHVFDDTNQRESIFSLDELELVREVPIRFRPQDILPLDGGMRVMNIDMPAGQLSGVPLHIVSSDGEILHSFGSSDVPYRPYVSYLGHRRLTTADGGAFWAADQLRYKLEKWDEEGRLLRTLTSDVPWFPPMSEWSGFERDEPPSPLLWDISRDSNGLIWILISVADEGWQSSLEHVQDDHGERWIPRSAIEYFDTRIEVIDPRTNALVATQRFDPLITHFAGESHVAGPWQGDSMAPAVPIWRIQLVQLEKN